MGNIIIKTKNLSKKYKDSVVVNKIDLEIQEGEIYGFLGPNGAGKTTTIQMLLGLIKPSNGEIYIDGKTIKNNRIDILKNMGSLVESPSYYGNLTAYENLEIIAKVRKIPLSRIQEVLEIVGLEKVEKKLTKNFSLGMKQRLGIGMAILGSPKILILDEPTNGLDPSGIEEIRELIKSFPVKYGMTVLVSSHLLSEIDQIATNVGIINKGNLIFQGEINHLRNLSNTIINFKVDQIDVARKLLKNEKIKFNRNGFEIDSPDYSEVATINKLLVENNINVYRIEEIKDSLERIFLNLIREDENRHVEIDSNRF